eukprot:scaffold313024_cov19-Prasinocladus_malaysianus.AAC.1
MKINGLHNCKNYAMYVSNCPILTKLDDSMTETRRRPIAGDAQWRVQCASTCSKRVPDKTFLPAL